MARSLQSCTYFTKAVFGHAADYDATSLPFRFDEATFAKVKEHKQLSFGVIRTDTFVTPTPPIKRGLDLAVQKLRDAGHEGASEHIVFARTQGLSADLDLSRQFSSLTGPSSGTRGSLLASCTMLCVVGLLSLDGSSLEPKIDPTRLVFRACDPYRRTAAKTSAAPWAPSRSPSSTDSSRTRAAFARRTRCGRSTARRRRSSKHSSTSGRPARTRLRREGRSTACSALSRPSRPRATSATSTSATLRASPLSLQLLERSLNLAPDPNAGCSTCSTRRARSSP